MVNQNGISQIVCDVQRQYVKYRKLGKNRGTAVELIRKDYVQELQDEDDKLAVLVGLALSLCKNKELYEPFASEALCEIQCFYLKNTWDALTCEYLKEVESLLKNESSYGNEAAYKRASTYVPNWKIGDMFSHTLTYPTAAALGIKGWLILLCKVGEYVDEFEAHRQLMYVSLCPPEKIPSCSNDIRELGFLRMMQLGGRSEYLAQITVKSKKDEDAYGLTKIGYYPDISYPDDYCDENPLTAMPLLGKQRRDDAWPGYEDQICRLYKKFGNMS